MRGARPAAVVALPRLATSGAPSAQHVHAHVRPAAAPVPVAMPVGYAPPAPREANAPILPPRTTGNHAAADSDRSAWRHWPIVVIGLAVVAILGAVVVLLWPPPKPDAGTRAHDPSPAPDRMDTSPLPDPAPAPPHAGTPTPAPPPPAANGVDPWDPTPPRHTRIDPLPLPRDNPYDNSADDPGMKQLQLANAAFQHWCNAQSACPDPDPTLSSMCTALEAVPLDPPTCAAATRCLQRFDHMGCSAGLDMGGLQNLFATFDDCSEAVRC